MSAILVLIILLSISCNDGVIVKVEKFPNVEFERIVSYQMSGKYSYIIEDGKLSKEIVGKKRILSKAEQDNFVKILNDPTTYGNVMASCFEPHIGYVFYDKQRKVVAHTTICLMCNWMHTFPDKENVAFSEEGRKKLYKLEERVFKK